MIVGTNYIYCPICKKIAKKKHCTSPHCGWYICNQCVTMSIKYVVFDLSNRRFDVRA